MADKEKFTASVSEGRKAFARCKAAEDHWRKEAEEDARFTRLGEQWPSDIKEKRVAEKRPCLTIDKTQAFVRQVVNDSRQNRPQIKVRGVDSNSDPKTADVINGLIRNIEQVSNADVAYDTGIDNAVAQAVGYIKVDMDYSYDDVFDLDLLIKRMAHPLSVYGDPDSTSATSDDWMVAFEVEKMSHKAFKRQFEGKAIVDFEADAWSDVGSDWLSEDSVMVAAWWVREEYERDIVLLEDGRTFAVEDLEKDDALAIGLQDGTIKIALDREGNERRRTAKAYKVKRIKMSGAEILAEDDWSGEYIPLVPVYGEEFTIDGKRYFKSLINRAKDAQRMFNYWRTTSTELIALAPRVPFIGRQGTFDSDADKWATANTESHAYLEFDTEMPQRQPLDTGPAAGALQEALNASDDMKAIIGLYDASMGARSNETSGKAIRERKMEGDVSTFHFIDNLSRAISHVGKIIIDLIPHVYGEERIIRVIGEDKTEKTVQINKEYEVMDEEGNPVTQPILDAQGQPALDEKGQEIREAVKAIHDLKVGKYDLVVDVGPSFTTRREEAAEQMTELVRAFPDAAPYMADIMAKNFDWPGADEIAKRFEQLNPAKKQELPPEVQEQMQQGQQMIQELQLENEQLKQDKSTDVMKAQVDAQKIGIDQQKLQLEEQKLGIEEKKMKHELRIKQIDSNMQEDVDEEGNPVDVSKQDVANQAIMQGLQMVAQTLDQSNQTLATVAEVVAAPRKSEPVRDEKGKMIGAVSTPVLN